ncbi:MAG TPA: PilC/PilY family type IV pilus protein [Smithellaceae bacterium]|nr:PilC/PilY family type IV pilus protein [Smithellaceae bacterium]
MKSQKLISLIAGIAFLVFFANAGNADTPAGGEEALFTTSVAPDALILLDLSGSMAWNPAGGDKPYGSSPSCTADTTKCTGSGCSGGFCGSSKTNCKDDCSRLAIAKRAIFNVLDDNNDNKINSSDEGSLGVRIGYMQFYNCNSDETDGSYTSGCIQIPGSGGSRRYINSKYSQIYCNSNTSCTVGSTGSYSVGGAAAAGGTPLASALGEAKIYLDAHKAADSAKACRQKFVILISDGADTYACGANGSECDGNRYKNRRQSVARAKALADAGYKVFVIGFGSTMPPYLQNTLNWMAYYGRTDNPNAANAGNTAGYSIATGCDVWTSPITNPTACCNMSSNAAACYPSGVTGCATDSAAVTAACYDSSSPYPGTGNSTSNFRASANDPGYLALSGYAFLAGDADELATAMKTAMNLIREATYSFSQSSIQSSRTTDENFVYEGSFQPVNGDPFWLGHLKKYQINADGTVGSMLLDAGTVLQSTPYTSRNMKTCIGCTSTLDNFTTSIDKSYFDATDNTDRDTIVNYIQGNATYNPDNWKLGDVFRSTPITIGSPSVFFEDYRDANNAFAAHRSNHQRTSALGNRVIVAGANDGQFHAFKTGNMTEAWSFIPPNLLSKLKTIVHTSEPTGLVHQYFVDGPVSGADVWVGSGDGKSKSSADWKTVLVFGEGRGSTGRLWSSSSTCATTGVNMSGTYAPSTCPTCTNYCGTYALDVTNSLSPTFMWRLNTFHATTQAPYIGESWSKMGMGRILMKSGSIETEKWVGFVGGGYNADNCSGGGTCDPRGKGFFVVDLSDGHILWSFTLAGNSAMKYSLPAPPALVDTDNDGFIDTAYIGDLGGNMWRFKFCTSAMLSAGSCTTSDWSGGLFFDSSSGNIRPIYTGAGVAKDGIGNLWVFWGTGDKVDPTASNAQEHFYAVKDNRTNTYTVSDISNITTASGVFDPSSTTRVGYRIQLAGSGQKILAEPTIFGGVAYFTSFTPGNPSDPCEQAGTATLNGVKFTTGAGVFGGSTPRQIDIGTGIASAPIVSIKPPGGTGSTADLYVTVSGGGLSSASTQRVNFNPPGASNMTNMIYWRDRRIQ